MHHSPIGRAAPEPSPCICSSIASSLGGWGFLVSTMLSTFLLIWVMFMQIHHLLLVCRLFQLGPSFLVSLGSSGKGLAHERVMAFRGEQAPIITPRGGSQVLVWSSAESHRDKHAMLQASSLMEVPYRQGPLRHSGSHGGHSWHPGEKSKSQNPLWERLPLTPRDPDEGSPVRSGKLQVMWTQDSPGWSLAPLGHGLSESSRLLSAKLRCRYGQKAEPATKVQ